TIEAAVVLGADGRNSTVASLLGIPGRFPTPPGMGLQVHLPRFEPPPSCVTLHIVSGGYAGLAPVEGDRWCLGALVHPEALSGQSPFSCLRPRLLPFRPLASPLDLESQGARRRATFPVRIGSRCPSAEGVLLIGDAAATLDPFSGQGISLALLTAGAAAEAA